MPRSKPATEPGSFGNKPSVTKHDRQAQAEIAALKRRVAELEAAQFGYSQRVTKSRARPAGNAALEARIAQLEGDLASERFEHNATHGMYVRALDAVKGVLTKAEWLTVVKGVHSDRVQDPVLKRQCDEALALLNARRLLLIKKADRPAPPAGPKPTTAADWAAMKRAATAKRKADRQRARPVKPPTLK